MGAFQRDERWRWDRLVMYLMVVLVLIAAARLGGYLVRLELPVDGWERWKRMSRERCHLPIVGRVRLPSRVGGVVRWDVMVRLEVGG